jgi:hypothetical protein
MLMDLHEAGCRKKSWNHLSNHNFVRAGQAAGQQATHGLDIHGAIHKGTYHGYQMIKSYRARKHRKSWEFKRPMTLNSTKRIVC